MLFIDPPYTHEAFFVTASIRSCLHGSSSPHRFDMFEIKIPVRYMLSRCCSVVSENSHLIEISLAQTLSITDMSTVAIETGLLLWVTQINLPITVCGTHRHHISLTGNGWKREWKETVV